MPIGVYDHKKNYVFSESRKKHLDSIRVLIPKGNHPKHEFKKGHVSWLKGTKGLVKQNSGSFKKGNMSGENHPMWKGGKMAYLKKIAPRQKPENCEICCISEKNSKRKLCYDHEHKTGKFRGWICTQCNVAIGMVKEDVNRLRLLINYLNEHK